MPGTSVHTQKNMPTYPCSTSANSVFHFSRLPWCFLDTDNGVQCFTPLGTKYIVTKTSPFMKSTGNASLLGAEIWVYYPNVSLISGCSGFLNLLISSPQLFSKTLYYDVTPFMYYVMVSIWSSMFSPIRTQWDCRPSEILPAAILSATFRKKKNRPKTITSLASWHSPNTRDTDTGSSWLNFLMSLARKRQS